MGYIYITYIYMFPFTCALRANLVLPEGGTVHRPHEVSVVVPGDSALGPELPLHAVGPVLGVEVVDFSDA